MVHLWAAAFAVSFWFILFLFLFVYVLFSFGCLDANDDMSTDIILK